MYVCLCHAVTEQDIHEAVDKGTDSFNALQVELKLSTCCGVCEDTARHCLNERLKQMFSCAA